jgi:hypothetical protein
MGQNIVSIQSLQLSYISDIHIFLSNCCELVRNKFSSGEINKFLITIF